MTKFRLVYLFHRLCFLGGDKSIGYECCHTHLRHKNQNMLDISKLFARGTISEPLNQCYNFFVTAALFQWLLIKQGINILCSIYMLPRIASRQREKCYKESKWGVCDFRQSTYLPHPKKHFLVQSATIIQSVASTPPQEAKRP